MEDLQRRIDSLIREIRDLSRQKEEGSEEVRRLRTKVQVQSEEIRQQAVRVEELTAEAARMKKSIEGRERRVRSSERAIRNESRRKELFNSKVLGSSKTQSEYYMSLEMKAVNERCEMMRRFMGVLSERFGLDMDVFDELVKIADGFDDPVIGVFLGAVDPRKENGGL